MLAFAPALTRGAAVGTRAQREYALCVALIQLPIVDQFCHESDGSHLSHQRGIKTDLVDTVHNFPGARRLVWSLERIDVYNENVARLARIDQREQRRISHIAPVPVVLTVNLDGLINELEDRKPVAIIPGG